MGLKKKHPIFLLIHAKILANKLNAVIEEIASLHSWREDHSQSSSHERQDLLHLQRSSCTFPLVSFYQECPLTNLSRIHGHSIEQAGVGQNALHVNLMHLDIYSTVLVNS